MNPDITHIHQSMLTDLAYLRRQLSIANRISLGAGDAIQRAQDVLERLDEKAAELGEAITVTPATSEYLGCPRCGAGFDEGCECPRIGELRRE
jgi:hypothetical protein